MRHPALSAFALLIAASARAADIAELHVENFDDTLAENADVLVHFYAPWSKRCPLLKPHLESLAKSEDWGEKVVHAQSDISDGRGYVSYVERYGIVKLPTLVIFRNGHATIYPQDMPLEEDPVRRWLVGVFATESLPRGSNEDSFEAAKLSAQLEKHHKQLREKQLEAAREQEKAANEAKLAEEAAKKGVDPAALAKEQAEGAAPKSEATAADHVQNYRELLDEQADAKASSEAPGAGCAEMSRVQFVGDDDFERVVMDKSVDIFVIFHRPSSAFCRINGTGYGSFSEGLMPANNVRAIAMDVKAHKSPFVFEEEELPVVMLFPASDKRPLEFDGEITHQRLVSFMAEHATTIRGGGGGGGGGGEAAGASPGGGGANDDDDDDDDDEGGVPKSEL